MNLKFDYDKIRNYMYFYEIKLDLLFYNFNFRFLAVLKYFNCNFK